MIHENEVNAMLIGLGVVLYVLLHYGSISRIPFSKTLQSSFFFLCAGYVLTVAEGLVLEQALNLLEHLCYAGSSVLAALWCYQVFLGERKAR